jgi:hypothetical protein
VSADQLLDAVERAVAWCAGFAIAGCVAASMMGVALVL